jgi:hypothetical protein
MRFSALSFRLGLLLFWALAIAEAISDSARKNLMVLDSCTVAKNFQSGSGYVKNLSLETRVSNRFFLQKTTWYILIFF